MRAELLDRDYWGDLVTCAEYLVDEDDSDYENIAVWSEEGLAAALADDDDEAEERALWLFNLIFEYVPVEGVHVLLVSKTGRPVEVEFKYREEKARADHEQWLVDELEQRLDNGWDAIPYADDASQWGIEWPYDEEGDAWW